MLAFETVSRSLSVHQVRVVCRKGVSRVGISHRSLACWHLKRSIFLSVGINQLRVQGYLVRKKHPPGGPYSSPMSRDLWWS